ncbi:hypothetical protein [Pantoea anthophila]|uniref:hypothetical protein n=1 Tax=Pantoea anthophila TaxID=470931 RepID=UPI000614EA87|nr:hypothetical protein [Pantoea anthophila]KKB04233.1 hypothetical protein TN98_12595 [Pantoea anthophila]
MTPINSPLTVLTYRRKVILGGILLSCSMICILMTIIFLYVSNTANKRVEEIRADYRVIAARRDDKVDLLTDQVAALQHKLDALPDRTADKTVNKVKEVVKESDLPSAETGQ